MKAETVDSLETLAQDCPPVFQALVGRDWMRTEVETGANWARWMAANNVLQIAWVDEEAALEVLELPFLDTLSTWTGSQWHSYGMYSRPTLTRASS